VSPGRVEKLALNFVRRAIAILQTLRIEPPAYFALTLLSASGYRLALDASEVSPHAHEIEGHRLVFPGIRLESFAEGWERSLWETFHIYWQSFGYEGCRLPAPINSSPAS
jgi:hypothetical protein